MTQPQNPFSLSAANFRWLVLAWLAAVGWVGAIQAEEARTTPVNAESRELMNIVNRSSLRATLQPIEESRVPSRAAGIIERYEAKEGQTVRDGDTIIILDSNQEKAEVAQADAAIRGAQAEVEHAEKEFERVKPLLKENIYSDKQFADAKYALELAQSRLAQAQASQAAAQARLANKTITSPINGIFFKKSKNVGEAVDRFETVARIIDISSLKMDVYVDASLFDSMRNYRDGKPREAKVQVFKSPDNYVIVPGKVVYVDPIIDSLSSTFRVRIELPISAEVAPGYSAILLLQSLQGDNLGKP